MANFCLLCLNDNINDLSNFTDIINGKSIVDSLKIVHPEIDPNEMDCAKFICKTCTDELSNCLDFKEKYEKGYTNYKFYKEKLQTAIVIDTIDIDEVKIEEDIIQVEETDREILQELINYEENSIPVEVPPVDNQFPCYRCSAILPDEDSLAHHSQMHEPKTPKGLSTIPVQVRTVQPSQITPKRLRSENSPNLCFFCPVPANCKNYGVCQICNIIFSTQIELRNHACKLKYQCRQCLKKFSSKTQLGKHILTHKNKVSCEICNQKFSTEILLREHLKTHQDPNEYFCEKCSRTFPTQKSLKNHKIIHNRQCDICERSFKSIKLMQHHKLTHINCETENRTTIDGNNHQ